jgi:hypothetical protein
MKFINCNDILLEKNGSICRDSCGARIPTDTPIFVKSCFQQILRNKTSSDLKMISAFLKMINFNRKICVSLKSVE